MYRLRRRRFSFSSFERSTTRVLVEGSLHPPQHADFGQELVLVPFATLAAARRARHVREVLERVQECLQVAFDFLLLRHEFVVGVEHVAGKSATALMSPSIAPRALGKTTLNCVSSTSSIDERHSPAIVSSSGASCRTASSACRCFSATRGTSRRVASRTCFCWAIILVRFSITRCRASDSISFFNWSSASLERDSRLVQFRDRLSLAFAGRFGFAASQSLTSTPIGGLRPPSPRRPVPLWDRAA